jgi:hypothetical protein
VHLGYRTYIWFSVSKLTLKCAVVSLYLVVKQRLKCNTGKVSNCLIQFLLTMVRGYHIQNVLELHSDFPNAIYISHFLQQRIKLHYTVCSESRCALRLRYADLVVSIEVAVEVCCCLTVLSCPVKCVIV